MTLAVGLTGGIASGKSEVSQAFAQLSVPMIDADLLARQLVLPGTDGYQQLVEHFGPQIVLDNGQLNRPVLRQRLREDAPGRQFMNQLLHPKIRAAMADWLKQQQTAYALLIIPLLVETLPNPLLDRILVVDCPEALQLIRLRQRDASSALEAEQLLGLQASRQDRLQHATEVLLNDGERSSLSLQVAQLHRHYLMLGSR